MERIGFLINKLKEQYEKADSNEGMLVTLQMLYRELLPKMFGSPALGNVSVVVPGQMDLSFLEQHIEEKLSLNVTPNTNGKQVFELSAAPTENIAPISIQPVIKEKPVEKPFVAVVEPAKNPFIITTPKVDAPLPKFEPIIEEKKEEEPQEKVTEIEKEDFFEIVNARFLPEEYKPTPEIVVAPEPIIEPEPTPLPPPLETKVTATFVPPKELHETIQENVQPSLNDKAEKRQPELFNVLKSEPLKDLKKAISINERFQYINHLFMKDETMYDRSLKTINGFNVIQKQNFGYEKN